MSDVIHLLPDQIANQIAAGEVIQRPASVVKELMENALDAKATHIRVDVKDGGRTLIQVIDNGIGMSEMDARMAFERHATSKIQNVHDLFDLHTMGFRGEALASIAAVAQVELKTRMKGSEVGTRVLIAGEDCKEEVVEDVVTQEGSVFVIKNLFYNVPARRKFLDPDNTENKAIVTEFKRIALVNPQVALELVFDDVTRFKLDKTTTRQRIAHVCGAQFNEKLLPIELDTPLVHITGFVGSVGKVRKKADNYFFVNGRYMKHHYFHKAIMQAYEQMVAPGFVPDYFIYFSLDASTIDVNVHPQKTEIKFEHEKHIWQFLFSAVREILGKSNEMPNIDFDETESLQMPVYHPTYSAPPPPSVLLDPSYDPFQVDTTHSNKSETDWNKLYQGFQDDIDNDIDSDTDVETDILNCAEQTDDDIVVTAENITDNQDDGLFQQTAAPCFQYKNKYIMTPLKSGLVIIDQHRAHLKILYDQYLAGKNLQTGVSQKMLFPEIMELHADEEMVLPEIMDKLRKLGFGLQSMGNHCYAISGVPAGVREQNVAELIRDILSQATELGLDTEQKLKEALALSLAKTNAINSGQKLHVEEMEPIVAALFSSAGQITPDGKKIMTILSDDELSKRFK